MALDSGNKIVNTNTGIVAEGKDIAGGYFAIDSLSSIPSYAKVTGALCRITSGTDAGKFYIYNGTAWEEASFGGGSQAYIVSSATETGFASSNQEITITTSFTDVSSETHNVSDLKAGETIYVQETSYPNRWIKQVYQDEESTWKAKLLRIGKVDAPLQGVQKNGTDVEIVNGKANITVPTQASDINAEPADATILKQANIVDNTSSTSAIAPLSANQGYVLQTEINNLKTIGRFLAVLDVSAGTVSSQPSGSVGDTYTYKVGDYYRVSGTGTYGPKNTLVFTIDSISGSSNFETGSVTYENGDVIFCSNVETSSTTWVRQAAGKGGTVQDVTINDTTIVSNGTAKIVTNSDYNASTNKIATMSDVSEFVKFTEQTLTSTQQTQARTNIAAQQQIVYYVEEDD